MAIKLSLVIPVYNRPDEIQELLDSLTNQSVLPDEVVIVEDGSSRSSKSVVDSFLDRLAISYFEKPNSGPGASRNYGMKRAKGDYFIILDSDCILPKDYIASIHQSLKDSLVDFFGGPDKAHSSFSSLQKAIDYAMTSVLTTAGIRGAIAKRFQPRSFNMGISKEAFEASGGFSNIHPGEDPDLTLRLWKLGFKSSLFKDSFVYHKRRISWKLFYRQLYKFGSTRPILNRWHQRKLTIIYWLPLLFTMGLLGSFIMYILGYPKLFYVYVTYVFIIFIHASLKTKNPLIALKSIGAILIMYTAYGIGYLNSSLRMCCTNKKAEELFPHLFFKN